MPKKRKKWKRHYYLAYASGGLLDRNPYPRKNKPACAAPNTERVPGPVADADKRQG